MTRQIEYSKRLLLLCVLSAMLTVTAGWLRSSSKTAQARRAEELGVRAATTNRSISEMVGCEDADVAARRAEMDRTSAKVDFGATWRAVSREFERGWKEEVVQEGVPVRGSNSIRAFRLLYPTTSAWPAIVDIVRASEVFTGVRVVEFEMTTSGSREARTVDDVRILLEIEALGISTKAGT